MYVCYGEVSRLGVLDQIIVYEMSVHKRIVDEMTVAETIVCEITVDAMAIDKMTSE